MQSHSSRPDRGRSPVVAALALVVLALTLLVAPGARAEPVEWVDPGGSGAKVVIDPGTITPGGRMQISGSGYFRIGGTGFPHVAIKPDDQDLFWGYDGPSAVRGEPSEAPIWFQPGTDGRFSGWIDVPTTLSAVGPGTGANQGRHWLRILSGVFSSDGSSQSVPITYQAYFTVSDRITTGALSPNGTVFQAGRNFTQGGVVTLRGSGLPANTAVTATLDGVDTGLAATTDAQGAVVETGSPAPNRIVLPSATPPGAHTLRFTAGSQTVTVPITVRAAPSSLLATPRVHPGGLVAFSVKDFVGVAGAGQKVAVTRGTGMTAPVEGCLQADTAGSARGTLRLPADASGDQQLRFPAGSSCVVNGPQNDLPARPPVAALSPVVVVDPAAPAATPAGTAVRGRSVAVALEGFPAGRVLTPTIDGVRAAPDVTVGGDGRLTVDLPVAAETAPGDHVLLFAGTDTGAASVLTVADPPVSTDPGTTPSGPTPTNPAGPATSAPSGPTPSTQTPTTPAVPVAPPASTPKPANATIKSLSVKGGTVRVNIGSILGRRTTVSVRSASKVRVSRRSKAKVVTFAATTTTRAGVLTIALRKDGLAALRRLKKVTVVVRLAPRGGAVVTKRLVLRR